MDILSRPCRRIIRCRAVNRNSLVGFLAVLIVSTGFCMPVSATSSWTKAEITASRVVYDVNTQVVGPVSPGKKQAGLKAIVEVDQRRIVVLDREFRVTGVVRSRFDIAGNLHYSINRRFVYAASNDGWIARIDLVNRKTVAEIRVGLETGNIALSSDGKWLMAGNSKPHTLVVLNAEDLSLYRVIPVEDGTGGSSAVRAVYDAAPRQSFIVALKDFTEVWELSYDPDAAPVYASFVHSYRVGQVEGVVVEAQPFARRRIKLNEYLEDFFFDPAYAEVVGTVRGDVDGAVYNLDARRKVAELKFGGAPHFGAGTSWQADGRLLMATPHLDQSVVSIVDMESWQTIKKIAVAGPVRFLHQGSETPHTWLQVLSGPHKGARQVLDKRTLEIVKTIAAVPDDPLLLYDRLTFRELKRLPGIRKKPAAGSGQRVIYNEAVRR